MAQLGRPRAKLDIAGLSDRGRRRRRNEDFWGRSEDSKAVRPDQLQQLGKLYLVSDGVGGNEDGDIASREAVEQVMVRFYHAPYPPHMPPRQRLERSIIEISREIAAHSEALQNNMAATLVAALIRDDQLTIANVGDSRAYIIRASGAIEQVSVDHIENGNQLTQAMGDRHLDVAVRELCLGRDEIVVLCTDGLHDLVRPHELKRVIAGSPARIAARQLIRLANRRAGHDNITVVVLRNGVAPKPLGLYLRAAGAVVAVAALLILLLGALNTLAPVQASKVNHYLGISRNSVPDLRPTATLSALELKATATTVHIQAEATRGIILPTLTPLPRMLAESAAQTELPPGVAEPRPVEATKTTAPSRHSAQPTPTTAAPSTVATAATVVASNPQPIRVSQPESNAAAAMPPTVASPQGPAPVVAVPTPAPDLSLPAVDTPPPALHIPPGPAPGAPQPNQPAIGPGRAARPSPGPSVNTPVPLNTPVPSSTALPTNTAVAPTSAAAPNTMPATSTVVATNTALPTTTSVPAPSTALPTSTPAPPTSTPAPVNTPVPATDTPPPTSIPPAPTDVPTTPHSATASPVDE